MLLNSLSGECCVILKYYAIYELGVVIVVEDLGENESALPLTLHLVPIMA